MEKRCIGSLPALAPARGHRGMFNGSWPHETMAGSKAESLILE